jgi:nucleotide-binding universal stress UspA family protein
MFEKILMPSDGSTHAIKAAGYCADVAKKYNAAVTLLYVVEIPPVMGIPASEDMQHQMQTELASRGRRALDATRKVFSQRGLGIEEELAFGSAVPYILNYAAQCKFDLIVIGSRGAGTGAIEQILIGSVAEGILHGAPCPVLMIRP